MLRSDPFGQDEDYIVGAAGISDLGCEGSRRQCAQDSSQLRVLLDQFSYIFARIGVENRHCFTKVGADLPGCSCDLNVLPMDGSEGQLKLWPCAGNFAYDEDSFLQRGLGQIGWFGCGRSSFMRRLGGVWES